MQQRLGDRWIEHVGRRARRQGAGAIWLWLVSALIWFGLGLFELFQRAELQAVPTYGMQYAAQATALGLQFLLNGIIFVGVAVLWFERRRFSTLIEQQQAYIMKLEHEQERLTQVLERLPVAHKDEAPKHIKDSRSTTT